MHAVGSEILCEGEFFVRGSRSCLRMGLRREVNVLRKLVYKGEFVSLCYSSGTGTIDRRGWYESRVQSMYRVFPRVHAV